MYTCVLRDHGVISAVCVRCVTVPWHHFSTRRHSSSVCTCVSWHRSVISAHSVISAVYARVPDGASSCIRVPCPLYPLYIMTIAAPLSTVFISLRPRRHLKKKTSLRSFFLQFFCFFTSPQMQPPSLQYDCPSLCSHHHLCNFVHTIDD